MISKFIFQSALLAFMNIPYQYGGKNPLTGFDCSGLATESLKIVNIKIPEGMNADHIFHYFSQPNMGEMGKLDTGSLVFFGTPGAIEHVGVIVDGETMIEARGGDATTVSTDVAKQQGAYVSLRHYKHRQDFVAVIKPAGLPW